MPDQQPSHLSQGQNALSWLKCIQNCSSQLWLCSLEHAGGRRLLREVGGVEHLLHTGAVAIRGFVVSLSQAAPFLPLFQLRLRDVELAEEGGFHLLQSGNFR